ncbi:hypothetical protein G7046_g9941 [Stylonectria norvegica]|nr:hypothetical protein G7046_g9941 [Stylonectria norvegica]
MFTVESVISVSYVASHANDFKIVSQLIRLVQACPRRNYGQRRAPLQTEPKLTPESFSSRRHHKLRRYFTIIYRNNRRPHRDRHRRRAHRTHNCRAETSFVAVLPHLADNLVLADVAAAAWLRVSQGYGIMYLRRLLRSQGLLCVVDFFVVLVGHFVVLLPGLFVVLPAGFFVVLAGFFVVVVVVDSHGTGPTVSHGFVVTTSLLTDGSVNVTIVPVGLPGRTVFAPTGHCTARQKQSVGLLCGSHTTSSVPGSQQQQS